RCETQGKWRTKGICPWIVSLVCSRAATIASPKTVVIPHSMDMMDLPNHIHRLSMTASSQLWSVVPVRPDPRLEVGLTSISLCNSPREHLDTRCNMSRNQHSGYIHVEAIPSLIPKHHLMTGVRENEIDDDVSSSLFTRAGEPHGGREEREAGERYAQ
ncbi:hypothetical protein EV401DRAFT_2010762, partial [Pisolithus croceorrhizus]